MFIFAQIFQIIYMYAFFWTIHDKKSKINTTLYNSKKLRHTLARTKSYTLNALQRRGSTLKKCSKPSLWKYQGPSLREHPSHRPWISGPPLVTKSNRVRAENNLNHHSFTHRYFSDVDTVFRSQNSKLVMNYSSTQRYMHHATCTPRPIHSFCVQFM